MELHGAGLDPDSTPAQLRDSELKGWSLRFVMCPVGIAIQSDGLRVNCRVRGRELSAIISSKGPGRPGPGSDPGVRMEQRGPGWRTSRKAWAAEPGLE